MWRAFGRRLFRTHQQHAHAERQLEVLVLDAGADQRFQRLDARADSVRAQEQHALVDTSHVWQAAIWSTPSDLAIWMFFIALASASS